MASYVDILNPQLLESLKSLHISAAVARVFDSVCKCFLLSLLNTGQIQLPKDPRRLLNLVLPYIVLQVYIPTGKTFTLEVSFTDHSNTKRRLVFANTRAVVRSQLHARVPNSSLKRETWLNLCVDVATAAKLFFPGCVFKCLDQVRMGAVCKIRRIFCMRRRLMDTTGDPEAEARQYEYDLVPASLDFPKGVKVVNQFVDCMTWGGREEKWFATEPRTRRKGKEDLLPDLGKEAFVRKYRSLNVKSNRERSQRKAPVAAEHIWSNSPPPEMPDFSRTPESPSQLPAVIKAPQHSLPASLPVPANANIFRFPESPQKARGSPEMFPAVWRDQTEVRHFTPPFVNVVTEGQATPPVRYDPVLRSYNPFR